MEGQRIGEWLVTNKHKMVKTPRSRVCFWYCACSCGVKKWVNYSNLMSCSKSCGCRVADKYRAANTKHGLYHTPFYSQYQNIHQKYSNPSFHTYHRYGGRGIKVLWESFESFKKDMYPSFLKHSKKHNLANTTLDRVDTNGHYCKENCKWATRSEQSKNKK